MSTLYPEELFEQIAKNVHTDVNEMREDKAASLIGIKMSDEGVDYEIIRTNGDIYDLLDSRTTLKKAKEGQYHLLAVLTGGWAAPNDDLDVAPSEHPERKRVRMTLVGNSAIQYGSILTIDGQPEDMYDNMKASGSLAESFTDFMERWRGND
jgi:hypothetical protein